MSRFPFQMRWSALNQKRGSASSSPEVVTIASFRMSFIHRFSSHDLWSVPMRSSRSLKASEDALTMKSKLGALILDQTQHCRAIETAVSPCVAGCLLIALRAC